MAGKPKFQIERSSAILSGVLMGLVALLLVVLFLSGARGPGVYVLLVLVFWPLTLWRRFEIRTLALIYGSGLGIIACILYLLTPSNRQREGALDFLNACQPNEARVVCDGTRFRFTVNLTTGVVDRVNTWQAIAQPPLVLGGNLEKIKALLNTFPSPPWRVFPSDLSSSDAFHLALFRHGHLQVWDYGKGGCEMERQELRTMLGI